MYQVDEGQGRSLLIFGVLNRLTKRYDIAKQYLLKAEKYYLSNENQDSLAIVYYQLGEYYWSLASDIRGRKYAGFGGKRQRYIADEVEQEKRSLQENFENLKKCVGDFTKTLSRDNENSDDNDRSENSENITNLLSGVNLDSCDGQRQHFIVLMRQVNDHQKEMQELGVAIEDLRKKHDVVKENSERQKLTNEKLTQKLSEELQLR